MNAVAVPMFFGPGRELFGLYHPPVSRADRETGVVLCNPFGRECLDAHRTFRHLGLRLSERGFHVLRFDYFGSGDSLGDGEEVTLERWARDVDAAIDELESRAGLSRVALLGLRLGASVAWRAAAERRDVQALLLWEPTLSGRAYLEELVAQDRAWWDERNLPVDWPPGEEVLGTPIPTKLRREIEELALAPPHGRPPAPKLLLIRQDGSGESRSEDLGLPADELRLSARTLGMQGVEAPAVVVSGSAVKQVVDWADRVLS